MRLTTMAAAIVLAASIPANPASAAKPSKAEIQRADEIIDKVDIDKLFADEAYAASVLQDLNRLQAVSKDPEYVGNLAMLRSIALFKLKRNAEAVKASEAMIAAMPGDPRSYYVALLVPDEKDHARRAALLEQANRSLVEAGARAKFVSILEDEFVFGMRRPAHIAKDERSLARSAAALLALGWPVDDQPDVRDGFYVDMVNGALLDGDLAKAKAYAAKVTGISSTLEMLVAKRYESVFWSADPAAQIAAAIAFEDQSTGRRLAQKPGDYNALLRRTQYLRAVGRDDAALLLIEPKIDAIIDGSDKTEDGFWLVNEAAYALAALGRADEAVALMNRLLALSMDEHPELVSMSINAIEVMTQAGKHELAAAHSEKLAATKDIASPYGEMWMWEGAACAYAMMGQGAKAKPWLDKLKAGEKDNEAALTRALLCTNELDAAAALLVRRFDAPDGAGVLTAIQDYQRVGKGPSNRALLEQRWRIVMERPDVKAAIERRGRILALPLARAYYGAF